MTHNDATVGQPALASSTESFNETERTLASPSALRMAGLPYFVIAFLARLPFAMIVVGVLTAVVAASGSLAFGGVSSAFVGIGAAVVGPVLGACADRFGQRRVLLIIAPINSLLLVMFAVFTHGEMSAVVLLLSAFALGATAPQVSPLSRSRLIALIAQRVSPAEKNRSLMATMSYESAADEMVFVFGPFLVGVLATGLAPWAPLAIAAGLTLVMVIAFALHPTGSLRSIGQGSGDSAPSRVRELFRARVLLVVVGVVGVGLFFGSVLTSLTSFMADLGHPEHAGLYYGVMGVGSAVLALGTAWLPDRVTLASRWLLFGFLLVAGGVLLACAGSLPVVVLALALMGMGVGPVLVTLFTTGSQRSPRGRSATVMTMLGSGIIVGQSIAAAITGYIAETWGTNVAMWLVAGCALVVMVTGALNALLLRTE